MLRKRAVDRERNGKVDVKRAKSIEGKISFSFDSITSRGSGMMNEDSFVANQDTGVFAVFDGATSLNPFISKDGKTGAFLASNIAREVFAAGNKSLLDLTFDANSKIRRAMLREGIDVSDKLNLWATSVAAIKINGDFFDWLCVSDSIILVAYKDGTHELLVENYGHDQKNLALMKALAEKGVESPRAAINDRLIQARRGLNVTYGVVAGEDRIGFLHKGTKSLENVVQILIFSDGMLMPKEDPGARDDFDLILKEYNKGGLKGWLSRVRDMEDSDPESRRYVRFKPHDDATAVAISFK